MSITITLSDSIAERLQAHAAETHLSPDSLAETLLADALPPVKTNGIETNGTETNGMHLPQDPDDEPHPTLEEVVAIIKATPPNPDAIEQGAKVGDIDYVQYLLENPPTDTLSAAEWDEQWAAFERELKEFDQARAIKRGLL